MKVTGVSVLHFRRQLDGRTWNPVFRWRERQAPLIVLETDSGARGIGEGWSRYTDCASVLNVLAQLAPWLIGREISHPQQAAASLPTSALETEPWALAAALSAIDIALWDAWGHEQNAPVWQLLGGTDPQAPVYASGGLYRDGYSEADLAAEIKGYRSRGFSAVKMKIAGLSPAQDLLRVRAVREAMGGGTLWVDAVNQLTPSSAIEWIAMLAPFNVSAIQSPLQPDDVHGLAAINRTLMPVVASEAEFRPALFEDLLTHGAVSYLQFCLPLCGGFSGACALDDLAASHAVRSTPQCFSTAVAQAATLHFAAARSNTHSAEFHGFHDHLKFLYRGETGHVEAGQASAGQLPGLGVSVPATGMQIDGSAVSVHAIEGRAPLR